MRILKLIAPFAALLIAAALPSQTPAAQLLSLSTAPEVMEPGPIPLNVTDRFTAGTPELHAVATLAGVKAGARTVGAWIAVDAIATPNYRIAEKEIVVDQAGEATLHFSLSRPDSGWPVGNYRFELALDGRLIGAAAFTIGDAKAPATPAAPAQPAAPTPPPAAAPPAAPAPGASANLSALARLGPPQSDPQRQWTVLIYLDADNDLEPFALRDLNEMEAGLPESGVEVVVLIDRAEGYDDGFGDWQGGRLYRVRRDNDPKRIASEQLADLGELNMGDAATLAAFVQGALTRFPAPRTALVMWDHGGGWLHMASDHAAPGTKEGHDGLSLMEVGQGVKQGLAGAGRERLDLVGFDMCLMAQLETAYELADSAEVLVASQAVEPGDGWPYDRILPAFGKGTLGSRRLAANIVNAYRDYYAGRKERVATQSAIDLRAVTDVVRALDGLAAKTEGVVEQRWPQISRSLYFSESYFDRTDIRKGGEALSSIDLLDSLKRMRNAVPQFPAEREFNELVAAMDRAVLANYSSPRHRLSHGLALYAPVTGRQFHPDYSQTRLARESRWPKLLQRLHATQQQHLSQPSITDIKLIDRMSGKEVREVKPGGGVRIEATVEGENVLWVHLLQAVRDTENKGLLVLDRGYVWDPEFYKKREEAVADVIDLLMPEFKGNRNQVWQEFVGMHMYVTDGRSAGRATIDGSDLSDLTHVAVPVLFKRPGVGEFFATVYFDMVVWNAVGVIGEIPQPDGSVGYRQIEPEASDEFTLLFEFIPDGGGEQSYMRGETLKWNKGLELLIGRDEPSELVLALQAESIGGQSAFAAVSVKILPHSAQEQQFFDEAKKVKERDLIGEWQWHNLERSDPDPRNWSWKPIAPYTEIKPAESDPGILLARFLDMPDPNWKAKHNLVIWDTRLAPTLRLIGYDDEGNPAESMNFSVLVSRWENGSPRLLLKYLVPKGWSMLWAKRQGTGAAATPSRPPPAAPQPPQAAPQQPPAAPQQQAPRQRVSLAGYWQGSMGDVLAMDESNYQYYEYNELVDAGTYRLRGSTLTSRSQLDGSTESYRIQTDGHTLILQDSAGQTLTFQKVQ